MWKYGLDVDLAKGDPVTAPVSGKVIFAGKNGGFGNSVKILAPDGNEIWLSHLDGINVKNGQTILAGQRVGIGGNSGNVIPGPNGDGSHLDITMKGKNGYFSAPQVQKYLEGINTQSAVMNAAGVVQNVSSTLSGNPSAAVSFLKNFLSKQYGASNKADMNDTFSKFGL